MLKVKNRIPKKRYVIISLFLITYYIIAFKICKMYILYNAYIIFTYTFFMVILDLK